MIFAFLRICGIFFFFWFEILTDSNWFILRVAKRKSVKEHPTVPRNEIKENDINIAAEIIVVDPSDELAFRLPVS